MDTVNLRVAGLPAHAVVVTRDDVWMEGEALGQFARVASMPGCVRAAAMPDLHAGRGIPVGAAFAFDDAVHPALVGGDAGCGVRAVVTSLDRVSLDALERRARDAMHDDPLADAAPGPLLDAVLRRGVRGLADVDGVDAALARLAALEPEEPDAPHDAAWDYDESFARALGTAGGGNHFVEVARVAEVRDRARAEALGMGVGTLVVLAHSGSRGLGGELARRWVGGGDPALTGDEAARYLRELAGASRFARANRFVLAFRLLRALGAARPAGVVGGFDLVHNDVSREPVGGAPAWVHRKGAAPARLHESTVVLGSRGAPSWVLAGAGCDATLRSVAHGAGRRMGRAEARDKLKARYRRAELARTRLGGRVLCADPDLLFEEHPDAYKPVEPVLGALLDAGLATPVASLHPLLTVKQ